MAEVDNGDVLRLGATFELEGAFEVTNVWHAQVVAGGGISFAVAATDVQMYLEDIYNNVMPKATDTMLSDFISLSNVTQGTTFGAIAWLNPLVGAIATEITAPGVCLFTWARTLKPRVQIRKYFGVLCEVDLQAGVWSSTAQVQMELAMGVHVAPYTGGPALTLQGVAYNRLLDTIALPISVQASPEPAYQRRRRRGRGS